MKKKCIYVWSLLMAMLTLTACSSDQNEDVSINGKTGTFELRINFDTANQGAAVSQDTRASTAIPPTDWSIIKQVQFILYDAASGKIVFSEIETPAAGGSGDTKVYTYINIPIGSYTLVAVANTKSDTDAVTTYASGTALPWTVANVHNRTVGSLSIGHKTGNWGAVITGNPAAATAVENLFPYTQPSEIFMGYDAVTINEGQKANAIIRLTREVSLMRVRIDQSDIAASKVDFTDAKAAVMLYNLPDQMGIEAGNAGGIGTTSTLANALFAGGAFSTTGTGYLEPPYTSWKDVIVFPNNGGRVNNTNTTAQATNKYFIVLCGIAKDGHSNSGGIEVKAGDPVFWYGQINEVFTPNIIREVNLLLKTGGLATPPSEVVHYGNLDITVNPPLPWNSNIEVSEIEM